MPRETLSPKITRSILAIAIALFLSFLARSARAADLVVYTYDSLAAKEGIGPIVAKAFKKKTGVNVKFIVVGDAGQLLSRIQLDAERAKPTAHLVLGLDQNLYPRMKDHLASLDRATETPFMKFVDRDWWLSDSFIPFDYGVMAFIADTKKLSPDDFPKKWKDLLKWRFRKSLLLQDPRTSSPGLGFVMGSAAVTAKAGEEEPRTESKKAFTEFWKDLRSQWVTLAPGWSQSYGMFLKGEAPLVWSYVTSEAYHRMMKGASAEQDRYRAVIFEDGHPVQIEGAAILKNAPGGKAMRKLALEFLELLTSEEIQKQIPETQWMMPVRLGVKLPPAFQSLPIVKKKFNLENSREKLDEVLTEWGAAIR